MSSSARTRFAAATAARHEETHRNKLRAFLEWLTASQLWAMFTGDLGNPAFHAWIASLGGGESEASGE